MKQYLTNTIIKHKNEYINSLFFIEKGTIVEEKTNKVFSEHSYLFLDCIYLNKISSSNYIAKTKVIGKWIPFEQLDFSITKILANELYKINIHNELLSIKDPYIKISRYLFYEFKYKDTLSFYIPSLKELSIYLAITLKEVSIYFNLLINKQIISKHNKLINILNIKSLEDKAFLLDL